MRKLADLRVKGRKEVTLTGSGSCPARKRKTLVVCEGLPRRDPRRATDADASTPQSDGRESSDPPESRMR